MLRHLRLARARGSLVAPNSPVQDRALEALEVLELIDREKARVDSVKLLASSTQIDWERAPQQFPEYFAPADPFAGAVDEDGTYDPDRVDEDSIAWQAPATPDEDSDISEWIRKHEEASFSAAEMGEDMGPINTSFED